MPPRVQTPTAPTVLPSARQTVRDPFVPFAAARGAGSNIEQIAKALSQFSPRLANLSVQIADERNQDAFERGKAAFLQRLQEEETVAAAVKSGELAGEDSPFFRAGLRHQAGLIAANQYAARLTVRVASELGDNPDLDAFEQVAASELDTFLVQELGAGDAAAIFDDEFIGGFRQRASAYVSAERQRFAASVGAKLRQQQGEQTFAYAVGTITQGLESGATLEEIARDLTAQLDQWADPAFGGTPASRTANNLAVARAIAHVAQDRQDLLLLNELKSLVKTGTGEGDFRAGLGDIRAEIGELFRSAADSIAYRANQADQARDREAKARKAQSRADIFSAFIEQSLTTANASEIELTPFIAMLDQTDNEDAIPEFRQLVESLSGLQLHTDQELYSQMYFQIFDDPAFDPMQVARAVNAGRLEVADAQTLMSAFRQAKETRQRGSILFQAIELPQYIAADKSLDKRIGDIPGLPSSITGSAVERAKTDLHQVWLAHVAENPEILQDPARARDWLEVQAQSLEEIYTANLSRLTEQFESTAQVGGLEDWRTTLVLADHELQILDQLDADPTLADDPRFVRDLQLLYLRHRIPTDDAMTQAQFLGLQRQFAKEGGRSISETSNGN